MTTTPTIQIPQQPPDDVLDWLRGKTPEELHAIEAHEPCATCRGGGGPCEDCRGTGKASAPRRFFPEALRYRNAAGKIVEERVLLVIPLEDDLADATREAVAHVAAKYPKEVVKTPAHARELIGEVRFELLDIFALVSLCVRNVAPPHIRAYKLHTLLRTFDPSTLNDVFGRIDMLRRLWDVRVSQINENQFWGLCAELARVRNASPFVALDPGLHGPSISRLAVELHAYRTCSSCSGCKMHSSPE